MRDYRAPLADMLFALKLAGAADLGRDAQDGPGVASMRAVLERTARLCEAVLAPLDGAGDAAVHGLERDRMSTSDGDETAKTLATAVQELCFSANVAYAALLARTNCAVELLECAASAGQKSRYLSRIASGAWTAALAFAERGAPFDPASVRCRAVLQTDGSFRLFGRKQLVIHGEHDLAGNVVYLVLARLSEGACGAKGLAWFIVPKFLVDADGATRRSNEVRYLAVEERPGLLARPIRTLIFGAVEGAVGEIIGERFGEPGRISVLTSCVLDALHLAAGAQGVAVGEGAYQRALHAARTRRQRRGAGAARQDLSCAERPDIKRLLLNMRARTFAARLLVYEAVALRDRSLHRCASGNDKKHRHLAHLMATVAAAWSCTVGTEVVSLGLQLHGCIGSVEDVRAARPGRDAQTVLPGAGAVPDPAQIVHELLHEQGVSLRWLIEEIAGIARALKTHGALIELGIRLDADTAALATALDAMLTRGHVDEGISLSVAAPFVDLLGVICGEWQMGRAALAAQDKLDGSQDDGAYSNHVVGLARFYAVHIAPLARAHLQTVLAAEAAACVFADALP